MTLSLRHHQEALQVGVSRRTAVFNTGVSSFTGAGAGVAPTEPKTRPLKATPPEAHFWRSGRLAF
jgi:hypothetical protein